MPTRLTIPAQNIRMDQSTGIDPIWYGKLKIVESFVNSNAIGDGKLLNNATTGFAYLPTVAGAPTGTPITVTGYVPMVYDTTNHKIWIYDTVWKGVVVT